MPTTVTTSKQFTINLSDTIKALIMAVLVPVVTIIMASIDKGELTFNWKQILIAAIGGGLGYLIKNWLTPSAIVVKNVSKETVEAVKEGDAEVKVLTK